MKISKTTFLVTVIHDNEIEPNIDVKIPSYIVGVNLAVNWKKVSEKEVKSSDLEKELKIHNADEQTFKEYTPYNV